MTRLEQAVSRMGEAAYSAGAAGGNGHEAPQQQRQPEGDDVVEGEFRQV